MPSFATIATAFVSSLTLASAAFSATSKNNVVYYWGQGPDQADLSTACSNPAVDIVVIGFINVYPDQGNHSYPGSNFGNACDGTTYTTVPGLFSGSSGEETELLKKCDGINPGIKVCQAAGKKVLLSLGGGYPHNGWLKSETSANDFADFLWGAFGPQKSTWVNSGKPRPFGDAIVDGFDFDIETYSFATTPTDSNGQTLTAPESYGYDYMIARLRSHYATVARTYYISGAPQCIISDVHLGPSIANSWYDFLFVQLYNTPECSARASLTPGKSTFTLDKWEAVVAQNPNPNIRVFLGLPASTKASASADYYLTPSEVYTLTEPLYSSMEHFGGIMLWEATYAARNTICGQDYTGWMEKVLGACASNKALVTACPSSSSSSSIIRSTSSVQSSTSSRISTTSSAQISSSSSAFSSSSSSKVSSSSSAVNSPVVTSSSSSSVSLSRASSTNSVVSTSSSAIVSPILPSSTRSSLSVSRSSSTLSIVISSSSSSGKASSSSAIVSPVLPSSSSTQKTTSSVVHTFSSLIAPWGNHSTTVTKSSSSVNNGAIPTSSVNVDPIATSSSRNGDYGYGHHSYSDPKSSSSSADAKPVFSSRTSSQYGHATTYPSGSHTPIKPTLPPRQSSSSTYGAVYTTVITTAYVDICPTGLTTVSTTYTTSVVPQATTPACPEGWTTTVTVFNSRTITLTRPINAPTITASVSYSTTEIKQVTLTIVPVPVSVNNNAAASSTPVKPVAGSPAPSVISINGNVAASSTPVKPVAGSPSVVPIKGIDNSGSYGSGSGSGSGSFAEVKPIAVGAGPSSSALVNPVYGAGADTAAATGSWSKTSSGPISQFTGAAGKVNVGAGVFVGLVVAVFAM